VDIIDIVIGTIIAIPFIPVAGWVGWKIGGYLAEKVNKYLEIQKLKEQLIKKKEKKKRKKS
jgi:hypothetical protein